MGIPYTRNERRAAQRLAKKLLRSTATPPELPEFEIFSGNRMSLRGVLNTVWMKPENLLAAVTRTDGKGNWIGYVVIRKRQDTFNFGMTCHSEKEALDCVTKIVHQMKALKEHPIVTKMRDHGIDPESIETLGVGDRYIVCPREFIAIAAKHREKADEFDIQNAVQSANTIIWQCAAKISDANQNLNPPMDTEEGQRVLGAAAFLLSQGIMDIDEPKKEFVPDLHQPFSATVH